MIVLKNLIIPLIPFLFDAFLRFFLLPSGLWWEYFDAGTLILTFCIWLLFLLYSSPRKPSIPSDTSVGDSLDKTRSAFGVFIMLGFMNFGAIALTRIMIERAPFLKAQMLGEVMNLACAFAIVQSIAVLVTVYLKSKEIKELLG